VKNEWDVVYAVLTQYLCIVVMKNVAINTDNLELLLCVRQWFWWWVNLWRPV